MLHRYLLVLLGDDDLVDHARAAHAAALLLAHAKLTADDVRITREVERYNALLLPLIDRYEAELLRAFPQPPP